MQRRSLLAVTSALAVGGITLSGCSRDALRAAQKAADEQAPGRLTAIEARYEPGLIGFPELWATYAVVDDPDAGFERPGRSNQTLVEQLDGAVRDAVELRAFRPAVEARGWPLAAFAVTRREDRLTVNVVVGAAVDGDPATVAAGLDDAVAQWLTVRRATGFGGRPERDPSLAITLIDPDTAATLPAPRPGWPTLLQLTDSARWLAMKDQRTHTTTVATTAAGSATPAGAELRPILTDAERTRIGDAVTPAVMAYLVKRHPGARVGVNPPDFSRLEGTDRTLRGYYIVCSRGTSCDARTADRVVGYTVDLDRLTVTELTMITDAKTATGAWKVPFEPARLDRD